MAVTIEDIAKEANVSKATVSRVINDSKAVSPKLRQRVLEVIDRNHFQPNSFARCLATDKSNIIGVIVADISNFVTSMVIKGINSVCQKKGYTVMICESDGSRKKEQMLLERMRQQKATGVLLGGVNVDAEQVRMMLEMDFPVVLVTQQSSDGKQTLNTVVHDNVQAVMDGVEFLYINGHRRIAFIGGPQQDYSSGQKRLEGFLKAAERFGLEVPDNYIVHGDFSYESGRESMRRLYEENAVLPTAVLACSDLMALGAVACAQQLGMNVPEELSVMGFDDIDVARYCTPALSTIRIPYFDEGQRAAEELFALLESGEKANGGLAYVPHKVIRRFSVKNLE